MQTFPISSPAAEAIRRLQQAGFEAWIVGGCVRDFLLGRIPHDYDITTNALPEQVQSVFAEDRVILTGLKHGTVTVLLENEPLEITTYRVDGAYSDSRRPDSVTFTSSLREDSARRDFTVNAMAWAPGEGIRDFFGGQADLLDGVIRCVGEPECRFREDALRILRALRFSSVLGFAIEEKTAEAAFRCRDLLRKVAPERIAEELKKLFCGPGAGKVLCRYTEILGVVLPEILPMKGFEQHNIHHCYDVLAHTAAALDAVPPEPTLRLAVLLHDSGKPECFSIGEDGQGHFYGHAHRSEEIAESVLRRLRIENAMREEVVRLVRYHDSVIEEEPARLRRWLNKLGEESLRNLLKVMRADNLGQTPEVRFRQKQYDGIEEMLDDVLAEKPCLDIHSLNISGHDLMELGLRGPAIGAAQRALLEQVLDGTLANDRESLIKAAADTVCHGE